jgi:nucleoside-diphosphate-sugar epimerase
MQKLGRNQEEFEILRDGTRTKSFLHVSDFVKAMLLGLVKSSEQVGIFNVGQKTKLTLKP